MTHSTRRPLFEIYAVEGKRPGAHKDYTVWRWRMKGSNGEVMASGEPYASKSNAVRAIRRIMEIAKITAIVEVKS